MLTLTVALNLIFGNPRTPLELFARRQRPFVVFIVRPPRDSLGRVNAIGEHVDDNCGWGLRALSHCLAGD